MGALRGLGAGIAGVPAGRGFARPFRQARAAYGANVKGKSLEKALRAQQALRSEAAVARGGTGRFAERDLRRLRPKLEGSQREVEALREAFKRQAGNAVALKQFAGPGGVGVDPALMARLRKFKDVGVDDAFFRNIGVKAEDLGELAEETAKGKGLVGRFTDYAKKNPQEALLGTAAAGVGGGFLMDRPTAAPSITSYSAR